MPRERLTASGMSYGKAVLIILAAVAVRALLDPWLGARLPFLTSLAGVAVAARYCRWQATTFAAFLGFVVTAYLFVTPRYLLSFNPTFILGFLGYSISAAAIITLGEKLHRARERVERELWERRASEQSLMEQARQLAEAQHISHIGSWSWDAATDVTTGSDELYRIYGLDPAKDTLPGFQDQRGVFYPVDVWEQLRDARQHTLQTGVGYKLEIEAFCGNKKIWVTTRGERVAGASGVVGLRGTVQDITERKATENELRLSAQRFEIVKDVAEVGFWFCDLPFDVLEWDSRVKEHFWLPPDAKVDLVLFYDRLHPDDRERTKLAIEQSIATRSRYEIEYRTVSPQDGQVKWIRAIGRTFYADDGSPIRFDGATFDITEAKRIEASLKESETAARAASAAKDAFIAQLSHELRTPLTPVLLTAATLQEDKTLPDTARQQLRMIERNISLEARLIDDLLDITRITHGKLSLRNEPCNLHSLLKHVVEMVQDEARKKCISISMELNASRAQLEGDATRLQQVFWNLLLNGVKFSSTGGRLFVRSADGAASPETGESIRIEIEDEGSGFDSAIKDRMFEPFEQCSTSENLRRPGLGLGLAITRTVVSLHGGSIEAYSAGPGKGARFTVTLPGVTPAAPLIGPDVDGHGRTSWQVKQPMRLLLVEDHEPSLQVISRLLTHGGHSVVAVGTVTDAIAKAREVPFDAVVSDIGLPDGTGHDLMKLLRDQHGLIGIALSGYGTEVDLQNSRDAGFIAHLIKPVQFSEIRRALLMLEQHRCV